MMRALHKAVAPLRRQIQLVIGRAVLTLVNDATKLQELQVKLLADEVRSNVERFQEYGFTSVPLPGAEAVAAFIAGNRDHGVVLCVADRRFRIRNLSSGEVALYDDQGQVVHLRRDGIRIETGKKAWLIAGDDVRIESNGDVDLEAGGDFRAKAAGEAVLEADGAAKLAGREGVTLDGTGVGGEAGVVQGACICAFTGQPHPHVSLSVKGTV